MNVGEPSATARRVAAYRLGFARVATSFGDPAADDRLQADIAVHEELPSTGLAGYLERRTAFFDSVVVNAIAGGVGQVVLVGAGYDARALRYAKPGVTWFELDHPDTQADKRSRLLRLGIGTGGVVHVPVDFATDRVDAALRGAGHTSDRATLFACEGVAGYLSEAILRSLLTSLSSCAGDRSRLAISIPLQPDSAPAQARRAALGAAVARMGEPFRMAVSRGALEGLLQSTGWSVVQTGDAVRRAATEGAGAYAFVEALAIAPAANC